MNYFSRSVNCMAPTKVHEKFTSKNFLKMLMVSNTPYLGSDVKVLNLFTPHVSRPGEPVCNLLVVNWLWSMDYVVLNC